MRAGNFRVGGAVSIGTLAAPAGTGIADLVSTTRGFLTPRMTTVQRDAISTPATGLFIYNTTTSQFNYYNGSAWVAISAGGPAVFRNTFTNGSLTAGILTITHNLAVSSVLVQIFNDTNLMIIPDEVTLTSNNVTTVDLTSFGTLTGTWSYIVVG